MDLEATVGSGGWVTLPSLRGFEDFTVQVRADLVGGEPRLLGLHLEGKPSPRAAPAVITTARLRALPLANLVEQGVRLSEFDLMGWARAARETAAKARDRPRGGSSDHSRTVAEVYRAAQRLPGTSPRQAVADAFHVSKQTADRYIREARRSGELDPYKRHKEDQ